MYKLEHSDREFRVRLHPEVKLHPDPQDVRNYGGSAAAVVGGAVVRAVPVQPRGFRIFTMQGLSLCLVDDIDEVGTQEGT
jgi:hypothetical protein